MALTKRAMAAAKADGYIWDAEVRGLAARVQRGTKTWIVRYHAGGKRRQITLGPCSSVSIEDARTLARRRIGEAAHGRDPLAELRSCPVSKLLDDFEALHRTRVHGNRPRADRDTAARLDILRELWGRRPAGSINFRDVAALLEQVRGAYAQNRTRALIRSIWNRGRAWGLVSGVNPVEGTTPNPERARTVRALTPAELVRVIEAADGRGVGGAVIVLLCFTGARVGELLGLRWADVDLDAGVVVLRRRKAGDDLVVSLGEVARSVLGVLPREGVWVFPGKRGGRPLTTIRDVWAEVVVAAKLPAGTRVHDVRAAVGTTIERVLGLKAAQLHLGHTDHRTTLRYVRPADEQRRASANAIEQAIADAMPPA